MSVEDYVGPERRSGGYERRLAGVEEQVSALADRVGHMEEAQAHADETSQQIVSRLDTGNERMDRHRESIEGLSARHSELHQSLGGLPEAIQQWNILVGWMHRLARMVIWAGALGAASAGIHSGWPVLMAWVGGG